MQYDVFITADGASAIQVQEAAQTFRKVLEAKLGGIAQFGPCFKASAKLTSHGRAALTPQEDSEAAAWMLAFADAEAATKAELQHEDAGILVRLVS